MSEDFKESLKKLANEAEGYIREVIPEPRYPEVLFESMNYSLLSPGKRIRASLIISFSNLGETRDPGYKYLAAAIEMIHAYSLIHDDLPCMDDDDMRRGLPSNHIKYGYAQALLAGDGLLNLSFETMVKGYFASSDKDRYMMAVNEISHASGSEGMVLGQVADMLNENKEITSEELSYINQNKTGALFRASCMAGGYMAGLSDEKLKNVRIYSEKIGELFQLSDDLLDILSTTEELGKPAGSDDKNDKRTYPTMFGIDKTREKINDLTKEALDELEVFDEKADFLRELTKYLGQRTY